MYDWPLCGGLEALGNMGKESTFPPLPGHLHKGQLQSSSFIHIPSRKGRTERTGEYNEEYLGQMFFGGVGVLTSTLISIQAYCPAQFNLAPLCTV